MNSADLDAGAPELGDERGRASPTWLATSSPPSVVISCRRSGTRQQACGRVVKRDRQHLRRHRHFEIERRERGGGQPRDVLVADVAPVLAQMRGDVVGAGLDGELRRAQRIGIAPAPRIPQRRDVIDVDAEADRRRRSCPCAPVFAVFAVIARPTPRAPI